MESLEDFEIIFYSGAKMTKSPTDLKIINDNGMPIVDPITMLSGEVASQHEHFQSCLQHCVTLNSTLSQMAAGDESCFPIIVGRRPSNEAPSHKSSIRDNNSYLFSTPKSQQGSAFNFSVNSLSSIQVKTPQNNENDFISQNLPIKKISVPGVGTATEVRIFKEFLESRYINKYCFLQLSQGVILIQFYDGSHLSVIPQRQGGGITYTQVGGVATHFSANDDLPLSVRDKYSHFPTVLKHLKGDHQKVGYPLSTSTPSAPMRYFR